MRKRFVGFALDRDLTAVLSFYVVVLLIAVLSMSCGGFPKTPEGRYAQGLDTYDSIMDSYRYYFAQADPETQALWKKEVNPAMLEMSAALDSWKLAQNDAGKEQAYINLQRQAVALLMKHGIIVVRKE